MLLLADALAELDRDGVRAVAELRAAPLTDVMVVLSDWWPRSVLLIAIGLVADLRAGRRVPLCALSVAAAFLVATQLTPQLKDVFDRARPALGDPAALVELPGSSSFPSGHATTAFAGAVAVLLWNRRLGLAALVLAALVALSRVYLAVHYPFDVLAGAAVGTAVGAGMALAVRRLSPRLMPAQ